MPRTTCEIQLYDEIGPWGVSSKVFADALKGEGDRVDVLINSPGGDIMEGLGICAMLRAEKRPVRATIMGAAASMASVIAAAAPECVMWDSAFLMLHNPQGMGDVLVFGEADDMREGAAQLVKQADVLDFLKARLVGLYQRGGKVTADISDLMNKETWMSAADALALGLVDKVIPTPKDQPRAMWRAGWNRAAPPSRPRAHTPPPVKQAPQAQGVKMVNTKRIQAILVALSGALTLAQEGAESDDQAERTACADLAKGLAPAAATFQALVPADAAPMASLKEALAAAAEIERVTGTREGLAGAVTALHRNARAAEQVSEAARVRGIVDAMIRDGQIAPRERDDYAARPLADVTALRNLLRRETPRGAEVPSSEIPESARPSKDAAAHLVPMFESIAGYKPAGGAQ